jgi:hypothetical protein
MLADPRVYARNDFSHRYKEFCVARPEAPAGFRGLAKLPRSGQSYQPRHFVLIDHPWYWILTLQTW